MWDSRNVFNQVGDVILIIFMYNKFPANKMNKQIDKEKETDNFTDNKDDRRINRKVCICDNKKKPQVLTHNEYKH